MPRELRRIFERFTVVSQVRSHGVWIAVFLLSSVFYLTDQEMQLSFDRRLLEQGELWRVWTGHFMHLNGPHFWLNMAGVLIVAVFFNSYCSARQWWLLMLASCLLISMGLYWLNPGMFWYMGLSGVLHSLFIVGAWYERKRSVVSGYLLLVLLVGKLVVEQIGGGLASSENLIGARVAVDAHLYGAVAGALYILLQERPWSRLNKQ
jgi:rhomboid family GlyGly-CTERM serine protease